MTARQSWRHSAYLCAGLWAITRVGVVLLGWRVAPNFVGDDLGLYESWGQSLDSTGDLGGDQWQYPPLVAPLLWASTRAGLMPWSFVALALAADAFILGLLLRLRHRGGSWYGPWFWAVAAVFVGPSIFAKLDIFPAVFALLAIATASQPVRSGVWAGVGAVLKVWPAFVLVAVPRNRSLRALLAWIVSVVTICALVAVVWPSSLSFVGNQVGRGVQVESVAAYPFLVAKALVGGVPVAFRYGAFEIDVPEAHLVGSILTALLLVCIAVGLVLWFRGFFDHVVGSESALLVVLISLVLSRVLSPQFNVWMVALAAMLLVQLGRSGLPTAALIGGSSLLTQVVYVVGYVDLRDGQTLAVVLQGLRITLLLAATALLVIRVARARSSAPVSVTAT